MATHCFSPLRGKIIRVTLLDECGRVLPDGTENALLATDGFVSVNLSAEVEDGTEILTRKADGSLCVNERSANSFKRFNVEMELCGVNPSLVAMISNAESYEDAAGDVVGFTVPEGDITKKFALELWTGISGIGCSEGDEEPSGYMLLPFVNGGTIGDITIDGESAVNFSLTGAYTKGQNAWGVGPYLVAFDAGGTATGLPTPLDPLDHFLLMDTGVAPPPSACDPQAMFNEVEAGPAPAWQASTAYVVGDQVTLSDSTILEATVAGTSGTVEPTAPGQGNTVTDGGVTWQQVSADPSPAWAATTAYALGDRVTLTGGEVLEADNAGTSGSTEPTPPAVSGTVVDGDITWTRIS